MQTPLFADAKPEPGGYLHTREIVAITGLPKTRLNDFQAAGLVQVRARHNTGPTAWSLCYRSDVATYVILSALRDTMDTNLDVLRAASIGLYAWAAPEQEAKPNHPVLHALYAAAQGDASWVLHIKFNKHAETGQRLIRGYCYGVDNPPRFNVDPWEQMAALTVNLGLHLRPLVEAFKTYSKRESRLPIDE